MDLLIPWVLHLGEDAKICKLVKNYYLCTDTRKVYCDYYDLLRGIVAACCSVFVWFYT